MGTETYPKRIKNVGEQRSGTDYSPLSNPPNKGLDFRQTGTTTFFKGGNGQHYTVTKPKSIHSKFPSEMGEGNLKSPTSEPPKAR